MVDANLHNRPDDADLDLSGLPDADHRAPRGSLECSPEPFRVSYYNYWRLHHSGSWISGVLDGLFCLHLPIDDPETPEGEHSTWHVRVCWTKRLHRCCGRKHGH